MSTKQNNMKGEGIISHFPNRCKIMRFEVKGDTIISENIWNTDVFKIVKKMPFNFYIWNIGKNMGSDEYIPLCQDLYPGIKDNYSINPDTLRAIKLPKEEVKLLREAAGWGVVSLSIRNLYYIRIRYKHIHKGCLPGMMVPV